MELVPVLSTIILIATLATLVLAILSYVAFRMREGRRPGPPRRTVDRPEKTFFIRYEPHRESARQP